MHDCNFLRIKGSVDRMEPSFDISGCDVGVRVEDDVEYRALLIEYRALLIEYRARSVEHTTLLSEYRAFFTPVAVM